MTAVGVNARNLPLFNKQHVRCSPRSWAHLLFLMDLFIVSFLGVFALLTSQASFLLELYHRQQQ